MDEISHRSAYRVMITIDAVDLSVDPDQRQDALAKQRGQILDLLDDHSQAHAVDVELSVTTGSRYAQVPAVCPHCGEPVCLESTHMDDENGAFASAVCQSGACAWSGDAVYRIIDLEGSDGEQFESAVLAGKLTPSYHSD